MTTFNTNAKTSRPPSPSKIRQQIGISLLLFVVTLTIRIIVALTVYGVEMHDTHYFQVVADTVLSGGFPYDLPWDYANYPPFWTYIIPAGFRAWGFVLSMPFDFMIKLFPMVMDGFISVVLFLVLAEKTNNLRTSVLWTLVYVFNPMPIYTVAHSGQVDSLPTGLSFLAAVMMTRASPRWLRVGALTLGLAMSIKAYPVIFLPFFLWEIVRRFGWNWRWLATITTLTFVPFLIQFLPFVLTGQFTPLSRMLTYMFLQSGGGGLGVFGWLGILKWTGFPIAKLTVEALTLPSTWGVLGDAISYLLDAYRLLLLSKLAFGALYLVLAAKANRLNVVTAMLMTLLLMFVVIGGYFAYYFMWLLPFGIWLRSKYVVPYSILGILADLIEHPLLNLLVWVTCAVWLVRCLQINDWLGLGLWPEQLKRVFNARRRLNPPLTGIDR